MTEKLKKMLTKKTILLALCVYVLPYLLAALPKGVMVFVLTVIAITALVGFGTMKETMRSAYQTGIKLYRRMAKLATMSEEEFSSRFQQEKSSAQAKEAHETAIPVAGAPVVERRGSGIPGCCLVKPMEAKQAQTMAQEWWDNGGKGRVEDLLQEIAADSPQTHTCQLNDYVQQISLPKEPPVLKALELVMISEGLCADYNEDGYFVIFWGQDANGKEAGEV